jgi:hypothetical protein
MCETNFMHGCVSLVGSFATIALILTALGVMLGLVKPADALKHGGAFVGVAIVVVLIVTVLVGLWSSMSLWQRTVLAAFAFGAWRLRQERRQPRKRKDED